VLAMGIRRSESRLHAVIDTLPDPYVVLRAVRDRDGKICDFMFLEANPLVCLFHQLPHEQLIGRSLIELHPTSQRTELFQSYIQVVETGQPLILDDWMFPQDVQDRSQRRYDLRVVKLGDGIRQIWRDVTESWEAQERLRASHERLQLLANNSIDILLLLDDHGVIRWVSPSIATLGFDTADWPHRPMGECLEAGSHQEWQRQLRTIPSRPFITARLQLVDREGVSHWMESQLRPFLVRDGTADGLMLSLRLIDDRVAMEHELHEEVQRKLLESAELVANLRCELEKWQWLDPTTGLPNRAATLRQIQQLIARAEDQPLAILKLAIDNFQGLKETFGSEHCTHLLCRMGDALRRQLHDADWLAQTARDEFVVIRAGIASIEGARDLAQQLQQSLATSDLLGDEHHMGIPVSIGVSLWPAHASSAEGLLQAANTALTEAKRRGPRQLQLYSILISEHIQERIQMELALGRSLSAEQLSIVYQPQVNSQGLIVAAEALLRWRGSDGVAIPTDKFIPIAEETGLIHPIGEWLIDSCFRQLGQWRGAGLPKLSLAINLSPVQLEDPGGRLSRFVLECLQCHGIDPEMVEFELTEMAIQKNPEALSRELHALAEAGFHLALDDFGTGYSSLELLHRLPFRKLKIDRCFVDPLLQGGADLTIVHATLLMAQRLGLSTVAEGVSNSNQVRLLASLGCELFQGHLYSPPVSAEKLKAMLRIGFIIPNEPEQ